MFKDFINKKVQVIVTLTTAAGNGGICPVSYDGILLDSNNDTTKLQVVDAKIAAINSLYASSKMFSNIFGEMTNYGVDSKGTIIISNQYIVSILLME